MESPTRKDNDAVEPSIDDLHKIALELERQVADFRIIGDGGINFTGSMEHGFSVSYEGE